MATSRAGSRAASVARDAVVSMLMNDHKRVKKSFRAFEKLDPDNQADECVALVRQTCAELTLHARLEEELFYPAARQCLSDEEPIEEAEVEHASAEQLISQIEAMGPDDPKFTASFKVLGEYVKHHVREEEREMFPRLARARLDWQQLDRQMTARREQLMAGSTAQQPGASAAAGSNPSGSDAAGSGGAAGGADLGVDIVAEEAPQPPPERGHSQRKSVAPRSSGDQTATDQHDSAGS